MRHGASFVAVGIIGAISCGAPQAQPRPASGWWCTDQPGTLHSTCYRERNVCENFRTLMTERRAFVACYQRAEASCFEAPDESGRAVDTCASTSEACQQLHHVARRSAPGVHGRVTDCASIR